jgi:hypothetical protein
MMDLVGKAQGQFLELPLETRGVIAGLVQVTVDEVLGQGGKLGGLYLLPSRGGILFWLLLLSPFSSAPLTHGRRQR